MHITVTSYPIFTHLDILIFMKSLFFIFMALKVVEVFAHRIRKNHQLDLKKRNIKTLPSLELLSARVISAPPKDHLNHLKEDEVETENSLSDKTVGNDE